MIWAKLALVAALLGGIWFAWERQYAAGDEAGYARSEAEHKAAELTAIVKRTVDNKELEVKQHADNLLITEHKNETLGPVLQHIDSSPRVPIGTNSCRPAPAAKAESSSVSDGGDTTSRVVREDTDRNIKEFMKKVEKALATGRTCQEFVRLNGLEP